MTEVSTSAEAGPGRGKLGLWDTVSLILGIVIGAGIYETAPLIFQNVASPVVALAVWIVGGLLSLTGALCYAELATAYPRSGGDYVYLSRAYGPWAGFLFGWCQLSVLMTGSIGMMAYIFASYAARLFGTGTGSEACFAGAAVLLITAVHMGGVVLGKRAQNLLTLTKVIGIGGILLAGFLWPKAGAAVAAPAGAASASGSLGLAMILVLYTFGGWNDAALVTAEVNENRRNIPRALVLGTLLLTLIYVLINAAYMLGLGFEGARQSRAIAADVLQQPLGVWGGRVMSVLVMISALGAVNGLVYTGSRIYSTLGEDYRAFGPLARWHARWRAPVQSLAWQAGITLALILLVGTAAGQGLINTVLGWVGLKGLAWAGLGGFETLLRCTAPVFWMLFFLTGAGLLVLRVREPAIARPFKVPLYPLLPVIFCGMCAYMLYSAVEYAGKLALVGAVPVVLGLILYLPNRTYARKIAASPLNQLPDTTQGS